MYIASTADGYCRATGGLGVLVVTYMVGGLSAINAVAGAYSDDLPLLLISGESSSNRFQMTVTKVMLHLM